MGRIVLSGLAVALIGLTAFGLAHALIIIPIWTRLLGGIPFAIGAGIALAWAFDALVQHRGSQTIVSGVQFGGIMYLTRSSASLRAPPSAPCTVSLFSRRGAGRGGPRVACPPFDRLRAPRAILYAASRGAGGRGLRS
jgi:hypothetical protein